MNKGKYVFAQLTDFLPHRVFDRLVAKYEGDKYVRSFTCWNQMLCMIFGQLTGRDSMRELMLCLEAHKKKFYHLGFGTTVTRRNFGKANANRDYRIYEEFAITMIELARNSCYRDDFEVKVDGNVYAFDSSTIDLCLSIFWWAKFRENKGGIKLHTLFDVKTTIPVLVVVTDAKSHDVNGLDFIAYESGSFYVVDKTTGVLCDQIGKLVTPKSVKLYPDKIRRIKYYDAELDREFVFITNNMELDAKDIAMLYKNRWHVELFFKWIKQHLRVKSFWGTSMNAVKIQVYCAVITYCLVALVGNTLKVDRSIYEILQILSFSLLDKTPINEILMNADYNIDNELSYKQLKINWE